MASRLLPLSLSPPSLSSSSSSSSLPTFLHYTLFRHEALARPILFLHHRHRSTSLLVPFVGKEDTELRISSQKDQESDPTPQDLEYISQIKRVLELLRKNRDMLFGEVKLTIMIEDPREVERRRLLGIEDPDAPTRDDLVAVLEEVNEGKIPKDKVALQMLAEELSAWPNLEVEASKTKRSKSLYAKATDTGIDPEKAAKRLNVDWDSAAEIEDATVSSDDTEVPPAVVSEVCFQKQLEMAPQIPDMPILTTKHHHGFQESSIITPQPHDFVAAREIAVDPHSLRDQFHLNQQQQKISSSLKATTNLPPPLRPPKSKFLSISQPNSAASSPRLVSKKKKPKGDHPQVEIIGYLEKSKSCGEGRASAPSEELEDLWFANPRKSTTKDAIPNKINQSPNRIHMIEPPENYINNHNNNENKGFKCCLYLPGFGKAKPVRAIRKEESNSNHKMSTEGGIAISRTVSLEKFECGSWAPSPRAVIQAAAEVDDSISSYFDLPSELIRCGGGEDDAHSPVTAAFVFEKDIKGVLKNGSCRGNNGGGRKSDASPRHVRFSTSSATSSPTSPASACITPRLRKAREEFNAFLEAQSA